MTAVVDRRQRSAGRLVVRGIGELFLTAGLILLLFVAYQLLWTNFEAQRAQAAVTDQIRESWDRPGGRTLPAADEKAEPAEADFGKGFGFMYIPRLGDDYSVPILEGVELEVLARGVGHYPGTAMPGELGNFAVAGHRATNGEPFAYLDRMRPGDEIIVETRRAWLTYVVDRSLIVKPTDVWVVDPVPGQPGAEPTQRMITLTTCNPRWASYERLIVFGELEDRRPKSAGPPPGLRREG